jgi:hypothetical protein
VLKGNSVVVDRGVDLATLAVAARSLAAIDDAPAGADELADFLDAELAAGPPVTVLDD